MYPLAKSLLFALPPEAAHALAMGSLEQLGRSPGLCARWRRWALARSLTPADPSVDLGVEVVGLRLKHPLMLAAGLDKDARAISGLFALGFSAVEVGTVTPRPQPGNPRPRLFRLPEQEALINRMGFNNDGAQVVRQRLLGARWRPGPVGVNIGKNKDTPLEQAAQDYVRCVETLALAADYVVVNASSPNTPGLRSLQAPDALGGLLRAIRAAMDQHGPGKPLFLKLAPDLDPEAIDALVEVAVAERLGGLIATNTTTARPLEHPLASEAGGLSGRPLAPLSAAALQRAYAAARGRLPIIGVGGIFTAEDAYQRILQGASALQLYTGFIYQGPAILRRILSGLAALLRRDGFGSVREAVGSAVR